MSVPSEGWGWALEISQEFYPATKSPDFPLTARILSRKRIYCICGSAAFSPGRDGSARPSSLLLSLGRDCSRLFSGGGGAGTGKFWVLRDSGCASEFARGRESRGSHQSQETRARCRAPRGPIRGPAPDGDAGVLRFNRGHGKS